jgi:hypothetical protein
MNCVTVTDDTGGLFIRFNKLVLNYKINNNYCKNYINRYGEDVIHQTRTLKNIAMQISPALECFGKQNIINGYSRPYIRPNAWAAGWNDTNPGITLEWKEIKTIHSITLYFDTDFDHPMESSQMGHPEDVMPFCVLSYRIYSK